MYRCAVLTELTEQRAKELKTWANGIPEGGVCNGSVKTSRVDRAPNALSANASRR